MGSLSQVQIRTKAAQEFDLMVYFASCGVPSKYGSWGLIEALDQPREARVEASSCPFHAACGLESP